jgi:hypothetical protein
MVWDPEKPKIGPLNPKRTPFWPLWGGGKKAEFGVKNAFSEKQYFPLNDIFRILRSLFIVF